MEIENKSSPKETYELKIQSVSKKDIKEILKEIMLKKARHICTNQSGDVK